MWERITKTRHSGMMGGRCGDLIMLNEKEEGDNEEMRYYAEALIRENKSGQYMAYVWNDLRFEDKWGRWIFLGRFKGLRKAKEKVKNRLVLEAL